MSESAIATHMGPWTEWDVSLPAGHAEFVVGDVHGYAGELESVIREMAGQRDGSHALTFLGDLVDRGPQSVRAVRVAANLPKLLGFSDVTLLTGNHEAMMLAGLGMDGVVGMHDYERAEAFRTWRRNGGKEVMRELRLADGALRPQWRDALIAVLGANATRFLTSAVTHRIQGNLLLCHAGLHPQAESVAEWFSSPAWPIHYEDMSWCWVREPFLYHRGGFMDGLKVIHGHTPEFRVPHMKERTPLRVADLLHVPDGHRLGLDGGSFGTGVVAGAEFRNGRFRIYLAGNREMMEEAGYRLTTMPQVAERRSCWSIPDA